MRFIIRLLAKALIREFTQQPSRYHKITFVENENTEKKKAATEAELKGLIATLPSADVVSVVDGDTLQVAQGFGQAMIRLDSIDCPEDDQDWGDIAKYGLIKLVGGKSVHIEAHTIDHHGRTVATIYVRHKEKDEWVNVNERMVTLGHAWVMRKFYDHLPKDRRDKLNQLEGWAKSKKIGLWKAENPVPPWNWRKQQRD